MRTSVRIMDRDDLERKLAAGQSLAEIGRALERNPSTVSYWVKKHGLELSATARHRPRGVLPEDILRRLIADGQSTRQIAAAVGRSQATVRHWLGRYGLKTAVRPAVIGRSTAKHPIFEATCHVHGATSFSRRGGSRFCLRCRSEAVAAWRRRTKRRLVEEAGGECRTCGYDRCQAALQFHHTDPATKRFAISHLGVTRSYERIREEAAKCVLLCSNCHAEVEAGVRDLP